MKNLVYIFFFIFSLNKVVFSEGLELKIAVASNFLGTLKGLISEFEKDYCCKIFLISDSSSNLFYKFINGADFDIFITADREHYVLLSKMNSNVFLELSFLGKLSVYSEKFTLKKNLFINLSYYDRVAIANKSLAPYGYAAFELLENLKIKYNNFVFGNNINQTFVFIKSLSSDFGFVSLSQNILHKTSFRNFYKSPSYLYSNIKQDFILLNNKFLCKYFALYFRKPDVKKVVLSNGYKFLE